MYASKFPTERSPVAKCVMIAEANTDAPKSFCDAPDGTGYRDMARSESSARELGRPVPAQAGGQESDGTVVAAKRVMTVERRVPACMAFRTEAAERGWPARLTTRQGNKSCTQEMGCDWCIAPRSSWKKLTAKADMDVRVCIREITENHVRVEVRLREEMRGRWISRGRRAACRTGRTRGIRI